MHLRLLFYPKMRIVEGGLGSPGLGRCSSALCCPDPPALCCGLAPCPDGASFGDEMLILKQSGKGSDAPHDVAGIHPNNAWFLLTSLLLLWLYRQVVVELDDL